MIVDGGTAVPLLSRAVGKSGAPLPGIQGSDQWHLREPPISSASLVRFFKQADGNSVQQSRPWMEDTDG